MMVFNLTFLDHHFPGSQSGNLGDALLIEPQRIWCMKVFPLKYRAGFFVSRMLGETEVAALLCFAGETDYDGAAKDRTFPASSGSSVESRSSANLVIEKPRRFPFGHRFN
jgi:hypothetical protein